MWAGAPSYEAPGDIRKVLIKAGASKMTYSMYYKDPKVRRQFSDNPNAIPLCHKVGEKSTILLTVGESTGYPHGFRNR